MPSWKLCCLEALDLNSYCTTSASAKRWGMDLNMYKSLKGQSSGDGARFFSVVSSDWTRGNRHKLKHTMCHPNIRQHFLTVMVIKHWCRLPREVVEASSLDIVKTAALLPCLSIHFENSCLTHKYLMLLSHEMSETL